MSHLLPSVPSAFVYSALFGSLVKYTETHEASISSALNRRDELRCNTKCSYYTRVGTLIVATIYLQLIQNRYMFRSFTVLHCSHQHCVQPVVSVVEVVGYL